MKQSSKQIDPAILDYYDRAPEESRLETGASHLEELRTRELIERHAPKASSVVLGCSAHLIAVGRKPLE